MAGVTNKYLYVCVSLLIPMCSVCVCVCVCVYVCVCVCDIKLEYYQKSSHLCKTFSTFDVLLHKTQNKVLLVLRIQDSIHV